MPVTTSNKSIVLRLIQKATDNPDVKVKGVLGKKGLQKSIYFFNLKHNRFNFKWADYGPLSGEVQQIFHDLAYVNKITIKDIKTGKENASIKNMLYIKDPSDFEGFLPELDKTLDEIIKFTAGMGPRELELLASVHYWAQRQQELTDECTVDYIHEKLTGLKQDAGFTSADVKRAIQNLKDGNFLVPFCDTVKNA